MSHAHSPTCDHSHGPARERPLLPAAPPLLEVRNAGVQFGDHWAVRNVTLDLIPGEMVALIGPNGAGKSTLFRAILGLLPLNEGEIRLPHPDGPPYPIGYVPQKLSFDTSMPLSVGEFLVLNLPGRRFWLGGVSRKCREEISVQLDRLGAAHLLRRKLGALSGGQLQRVLIAASLLRRPRLLLLDEPSTGIDRQGTEELEQLLLQLRRDGLAIFMVTHDLHLVSRVADRVGCLNQQLCAFGTPPEVMHDHFLREIYRLPSFTT